MKKRYTIYFQILFIFVLYGQNNLKLKWSFNISDTTIKKIERRYWGTPWDILETKQSDVLLLSQQFFGWTIEKIDITTGKTIWKNARNQDFPSNSKKMFLVDGLFERKDGNIDIVGSKSFANDPTPYFDGTPVRATYSVKNGIELNYFEKNSDSNVLNRYKVSRTYIPDTGGYLLLNGNAFSKDSLLSLRTIDTNMVIKDTLQWFSKGADSKNPNLKFNRASPPHKIGNNIYFLTYMIEQTNNDTTSFRHFLTKVNTKGKILLEKNISLSLYYSINYTDYKRINDGFIITGIVDTLNDNKIMYNSSVVIKLDTLGNKNWEVKLLHPQKKEFNATFACEDKNRRGYWIFASNTLDSNPYLYFINEKGQSKLLGKIVNEENSEAFAASNLWSLKDGNLILSYRYQKCDNDNSFPYCWAIGLLEKKYLDITLNTPIKEFDNKDILLYPNPANKYLKLEGLNENYNSIEIFNSIGQIVYNDQEFKKNEISTEHYPDGIYFIRIGDKNKNCISRRFVICH